MKRCQECGLPNHGRRYKYCSETCAAAGYTRIKAAHDKRRNQAIHGPRTKRVCKNTACGKRFTPHHGLCLYCRSCQRGGHRQATLKPHASTTEARRRKELERIMKKHGLL